MSELVKYLKSYNTCTSVNQRLFAVNLFRNLSVKEVLLFFKSFSNIVKFSQTLIKAIMVHITHTFIKLIDPK